MPANTDTDAELMLAALKNCQRLFDEALPKFNWGSSFLDANAIRLLNEVPVEVAGVIKRVEPNNPIEEIKQCQNTQQT